MTSKRACRACPYFVFFFHFTFIFYVLFSLTARCIIDDKGSLVSLYENFLGSEFTRNLMSELSSCSINWVKINSRQAFLISHIPYSYGKTTHCPNTIWPPTIAKLMCMLNSQFNLSLNSVLVNKYENGFSHVGWHADKEPEIVAKSAILSVSLGIERPFEFRNKMNRSQVIPTLLTPGSLLIMSGNTQNDWEHRVPPATCTECRLNLTFRQLH